MSNFFMLYNRKMKFRNFFKKIGNFIIKHKWSALLIALTLIVAGFIAWDNLTFQGSTDLGEIKIKKKPKVETIRAPLSGKMVASEVAKKTPIAVVVENHPDARPQSGLNKAAIVFETLAEGGITRFLAIYQDEDAAEIGPVRSARPYFVDWAHSLKAYFAHVGGNSNALAMIPKLGVYDLNQFSLSSYFWRDNKRFAPHNVYTTTEKLREAAKAKKYPQTNENIASYSFKNDEKPELRGENSSFVIGLNYGFAVTYNYQKSDNFYYRFMNGAKQTDRPTGEQIRAKNVIVCFSDITPGKSTAGEQMMNIRTTGTGTASIYLDGKVTPGTWKRSDGGIIRFYKSDGSEVKLNAGTTWVEFIPIGTPLS